MNKFQYIQIIVRAVLLVSNGVLVFYAYQKQLNISSVVLFFLLLIQLYALTDYVKKIMNEIEKAIDCLLHNDYSSSFSTHQNKSALHYKTSLLLNKQRELHLKNTSEKLIFSNIIESLSFGVLILRKGANENLQVFHLNNSFSAFLKIPKIYNWELLQPKIGAITNFVNDWKATKHTISLNINNETETFFLKTSLTQTHEYEYLILSLETIQQLIDKKEKEAWYKLMNVMSHEIINTITPISSLAESLDSLLTEDDTDENTLFELSEGLKIIKRRSYDLTSFVDNYRKLAEIPRPNKVKINIFTIVNSVLELFRQDFIAHNITIALPKENGNIYINIDVQQIEQVLINLISNSIYALKSIEKPTINIDIKSFNNRVLLSITDNGIGISEEIKHKIFTPYFTTRKNGSGIGLALSKSIIEAHNGKIVFKSNKNHTTFEVYFV